MRIHIRTYARVHDIYIYIPRCKLRGNGARRKMDRDSQDTRSAGARETRRDGQRVRVTEKEGEKRSSELREKEREGLKGRRASRSERIQ